MSRRPSAAALNFKQVKGSAEGSAGGARRASRASRAALESLEGRLLFAVSNYALGVLASLDTTTATYSGLAIDSNGNLFGTAPTGGPSGNGSVFELPAGGSALQTVATFNGTNGSNPQSRLVADSAGNLYGTTLSGGDNGFGTVFELVKNTDGSYSLTTLASFTGYAGNGAAPQGPLSVDANGNLFGVTAAQPTDDTTNTPGIASGGTVFEIPVGSNTISTVGDFSQADAAPQAGLAVDGAGDVFGTMSGVLPDGTNSNPGTVFEIVRNADGTYARPGPYASFDSTTGSFPVGNLTIDSAGDLFGVTLFGGPNNYGTVFEVPYIGAGSTPTIQTLASFSPATGRYPSGGLFVDSSGDLFGTTYSGGNNDDGTVYELPAGTGTINTLASFNTQQGGTNTGGGPNPGLVQDAAGDFFGTTGYGGSDTSLDGTLFKLSPVAAVLPVASLSAPAVSVAGTTPEKVTVTYTDPNGINESSINAANLTVTDPNGNPLTVEPALSVTRVTNPTGGAPLNVTATYTVDAPAGGWSQSNNGTYNLTVAGVFDANNQFQIDQTTGTFRVGIGTGPKVTITAPDVTTPGNHYSQVTLNFSDPAGISLLSVASLQQNLVVIGPASLGNPRLALQDQNTTPPLGGGAGQTQKVTVTYDIAAPFVPNGAPKGDWFVGDNGTYTITLPAGVVFDSSHTFPNDAKTVTFQVKVPDNPPTATFVTPAPVATPTASAKVTVTYTGAQDIDPATINANNISVVGPNNNVLAVTGFTTDDSGNVPVPKVTVTYTVSAPSGFGGFTSDLNGAYSVSLNPNQPVKDVAHRSATAATGTNFVVNVPPANASNPGTSLGFSAQDALPAGNGKVLTVGFQSSPGGGTDAVLEQLTASGQVDSSFGTNGKVIVPGSRFFGVSLGADGNIYATGNTSDGSALLAAFKPDGTPAPFGTNGRVTVPGLPGAVFYSAAIDPNNNDLVAAGGANGKFLVDRFTHAGQQDPAFNGGKPLTFSDGGSDVLGHVAVQIANSAIVAAGAGGASGASVVVTQVTAGGTLDTSFGSHGFAVVPQLATLGQVGGQLDNTEGLDIDRTTGNIVVANSTATGDFGVARLTPAGALDPTWGTNGVVTTDFKGGLDDADAVVIQPDGSQIFVAGTTTDKHGTFQTAVAAYTSDGKLDPSFGTGGQETFDPVTPSDGAVPSASPSVANPSLLVRPSRQARPDAVNLSEIVHACANLTNGHLVVGANGPHGSGQIKPLVVPSPRPRKTGEMQPTVTTNWPAQVIGGTTQRGRQVTVTFTNTTNSTLSGPFTFTAYLTQTGSAAGGSALGSMTLKSLKLKAGARKTVRIKVASVPVLAEGGYYLLAVVKSPDGQVSQGPADGSFNVVAPKVTLTLAAGPTSVRSGRKATLPLTLTDTGNVPVTGTATVTVTAAPAAGGTRQTTANALPLKVNQKPGAGRKYRLSFPVTLAKGNYSLNVSLSGLGLAKPVTASSTLVVL